MPTSPAKFRPTADQRALIGGEWRGLAMVVGVSLGYVIIGTAFEPSTRNRVIGAVAMVAVACVVCAVSIWRIRTGKRG